MGNCNWKNFANPAGQFWRAGVGYVGQHGVARGGRRDPAATKQLRRASIAVAAASTAAGFAAAAVPTACLQHSLRTSSWTKKSKFRTKVHFQVLLKADLIFLSPQF